jgi:uncharacterized membrane protein YgcG
MLRGIRRRAHLVVALSIVIMVGFALTGVVGEPRRSERIEQLQVVATAEGDNAMRITETIDYDFGSEQRRGYQRVVPHDFGEPTDITASSPDAPDDLSVTPTEFGDPVAGTRIRVGNPDVFISGQHRYVISYVLPLARFASDPFSWDAVGSESEIPIEDVTVVLDGIELADPTCSVGAAGADGGCEVAEADGRQQVVVDQLDPFEGITISGEVVRWESGDALVALPPPERRADRRVLVALVVAVLGTASAAAVYLWARRTGANEVVGTGAAEAAHGVATGTGAVTSRLSDAELAELSTVEFAPPRGLEPWQGAVAVREVLDDDSVTAWFSGAVADGLVDIEPRGKHARLSRGLRFDEADPVSARILAKLFGTRKVVDLDGYDAKFASAWTEVQTQQDRWVAQAGWWWGRVPEHGRIRPGGCATAGVLLILVVPVFFVSVTLLSLFGVVGAVFTVVAFGAGVPALVARVAYAPLLPGRTANGSAYALQTESFRRFLVESEGQHVEWAWQNGLLRQYSAWAVALDAADAWEHAMERAGVPRPEIDATAAPLLVHSMRSSFATSHVEPSASGSGSSGSWGGSSSGGFSGSVGGGGGGGSHGSW